MSSWTWSPQICKSTLIRPKIMMMHLSPRPLSPDGVKRKNAASPKPKVKTPEPVVEEESETKDASEASE